MMTSLFGDLWDQAAPDKPVRVKSKGLYAAMPGTGPAGETCGSCAHLSGHTMSRRYYKCALTRAEWTGGAGTDLKVRSPACAKWERARQEAGR